jgi:cobalamin synthase
MWLVPGSNLGFLVILGVAAAAAAAVSVTAAAQNAFGGVTGDVMGAAHEAGRAAAIIAVVSAWGI